MVTGLGKLLVWIFTNFDFFWENLHRVCECGLLHVIQLFLKVFSKETIMNNVTHQQSANIQI